MGHRGQVLGGVILAHFLSCSLILIDLWCEPPGSPWSEPLCPSLPRQTESLKSWTKTASFRSCFYQVFWLQWSKLTTVDKHTLMCSHHHDLKKSKKASYQLSSYSLASSFPFSWVSTHLSPASVDLPSLHTSSKCSSVFHIHVLSCVSLFKL